MKLLLLSEEQTFSLGKKIAAALKGGEVILLNGDMGAGKTTLTQGIAKGLEISSQVGSPTFTLMNIYSGRLALYHYDLFRLESASEAEEAGLTEYFGTKNGVCVIEWADKIALDFSYYKPIEIVMRYIDENTREATLNGLTIDENDFSF